MAIKFDKYTGSGYIDVDIDYTEHKNRKYYLFCIALIIADANFLLLVVLLTLNIFSITYLLYNVR